MNSKLLLTLSSLLILFHPAFSAVILGWDTADNSGEGEGVVGKTAEYVDPNLVGTSIELGLGLSIFSEGAGETRIDGLDVNSSIADLPDDDYISITVTPAAGSSFSLDATNSLQLAYQGTTGGRYDPNGNDYAFHLRSSADSFSSDLDVIAVDDFGSAEIDLFFDVGTSFTNVSASTEFRIYFTEGPDGGFGFGPRFFIDTPSFSAGSFSDLDVVVNGSTVPEPSAYAAMVGGLALALVWWRRSRA